MTSLYCLRDRQDERGEPATGLDLWVVVYNLSI